MKMKLQTDGYALDYCLIVKGQFAVLISLQLFVLPLD